MMMTEDKGSEGLNFHPEEIPVGDILWDAYDDNLIRELLDSEGEGEGEDEVKPRLVCDEMTGPQVDTQPCLSHHQIFIWICF